MKILVFVSFLLMSVNSFSHCPIEFKEINLCGAVTWIDGPYDGKVSKFQVNFWEKGDQYHEPISPAYDIDIYSWMIMENGHSHGGPQMSYQEVSQGIFEVNDARFFMGGMRGFWEVRIELFNDLNQSISLGASRVPLSSNGGGHGGGHHH